MEMRRQKVDAGWRGRRCAEAIAADHTLLDREAVGEQVFRIRYGDEAWKAAIGRKKKPWQEVVKEAAE